MMRIWFLAVPLSAVSLSACMPADARQEQIANIQDTADAEAHDLQAELGAQAAKLRAQADAMELQAATSYGPEVQGLYGRIDAVRAEAAGLERQAREEAAAIQARARDDVTEIRAAGVRDAGRAAEKG